MASKLLTDTSIKAGIAKVKGVGRRLDLRDRNVSGLVLRISPTGSAVWSLQYRRKGQRVPLRVRLGIYPDLGLAAARGQALDLRKGIAHGTDPIEAREAERSAKAAAKATEIAQAARITFGEVAEEYLRERIPKEKNRRKLGHMFRNAFEPLRAKALADVTTADAMAVYHKIARRGSKAQAAHAFAYVRSTLQLCRRAGLHCDGACPHGQGQDGQCASGSHPVGG